MADQPDHVDVYVGNMIRALRKRAGVSQDRLASAIGISFQQVQKYEKGDNRVSASMLSRIARFMNAPPAAFFPPIDEDGVTASLGPIEHLAAAAGGLELAEAFLSIPSHARAGLLRVAEAMSGTYAPEPGAAYITGGDPERRAHVI